ncbi:hypothetical protein OH77DRAFT_365396 [Trametes cingulata]|nr:hypothetical protein OH77DRAFT_365396 [Trametes cingulata]
MYHVLAFTIAPHTDGVRGYERPVLAGLFACCNWAWKCSRPARGLTVARASAVNVNESFMHPLCWRCTQYTCLPRQVYLAHLLFLSAGPLRLGTIDWSIPLTHDAPYNQYTSRWRSPISYIHKV